MLVRLGCLYGGVWVYVGETWVFIWVYVGETWVVMGCMGVCW